MDCSTIFELTGQVVPHIDHSVCEKVSSGVRVGVLGDDVVWVACHPGDSCTVAIGVKPFVAVYMVNALDYFEGATMSDLCLLDSRVCRPSCWSFSS